MQMELKTILELWQPTPRTPTEPENIDNIIETEDINPEGTPSNPTDVTLFREPPRKLVSQNSILLDLASVVVKDRVDPFSARDSKILDLVSIKLAFEEEAALEEEYLKSLEQ